MSLGGSVSCTVLVLYLLVDGLYEGEDVPGWECLLLLHLQLDPCTVLVLYLLVDGLYEGEDVPGRECLLYCTGALPARRWTV